MSEKNDDGIVDGSDGDTGEQPGDNSVEESKATSEKAATMTRRVFGRVVALLGIGALAEGISGGSLSGLVLSDDHGEEGDDHHETPDLHAASEEEAARVEEVSKKIATDLEGKMEGLDQRERSLKMVDYIGTAVFAWGIKDLMPDLFESGHGHIHAAHYGAMAALTALKASLSDEEGKHHLKAEWVSTAKAFGIISGTIALAEGLNMDLVEAYEEAAGRAPSREDKIALMGMLASTLSPIATTVGSASIMRKISNEFADGDPAIMATCVSHTSNLSGYLLFGDPPFIAVCEKYGFEEGIKWQFKTMWPLAIYSLFSSTMKLNHMMAKKDGLEGKEAVQAALKNTTSGLARNIPFLAKIAAKSLANVASYFTGMKQNVGGLQVAIGEVLTEKFANLAKLPFADEFDSHGHDAHEGLLRPDPEVRAGNDVVATILEKIMAEKEGASEEGGEDEGATPSDLRKAIDDGDWDEVRRLGSELSIPIEPVIDVLKDLHDNAQIDGSADESQEPSSLLATLNPVAIYDKATNVGRIGAAMGHNLADVMDVFPFQAGSVPFLITAFKDAVSSMEAMGLSETQREIVTFFMIMIFSMFADNYVGAKIGLELYPKKPEIALIAAIQGGSHTAIGNMANIAQFDLNTFSLKDSFKQLGLHFDNIAVGLLWSRALGLLSESGMFTVPDVAKKPGAHASADEVRALTRRELLFGRRRAEEEVAV
ncbi:hypothetical protein HOE67_00570 [Candidatus Peregrinibacteria bacterium]|jgi:hypothetical protein|nr:hypothetical protein [Candidatus Peregrinibacteria bacterium]MBT4055583.1 hypothetical protein [Candidatus Peregrinibacteria bacterium]